MATASLAPSPAPSSRAQDPQWFRRVLGQNPTGVTVVTAIDAAGHPEAMVVGTFTSVSLDPPLVAFLPSRTSRSWGRIRPSGRFCVNIVSSTDDRLCRQFTARDGNKFADVHWRPGRSGSPVLENAVAWIDCETDVVHQAGDHDIVIGRVLDLDTGMGGLPLVFFQGGYGSFIPQTMVASDAGLPAQVDLVDRARPLLEGAARSIEGQVGVAHCDGNNLTFIASAGQAADQRMITAILGERMPITAPVGIWWMSRAAPEDRERWMRDITDTGQRDQVARALRTIRQDGGLTVGLGPIHDGVGELLEDRAAGRRRTAVDEAVALAHLVRSPLDFVASRFGDRDTAADHPEVRSLWAPVLDADGRVVVGVMATGFPTGRALTDVARHVRHLATAISTLTATTPGGPA